MNRRTFLTASCACGALFAARSDADTATPAPANPLAIPLNPEQIRAFLTEIDARGDAALTDAVFSRWGYHCFHTRASLKDFAAKQRANFQGYVDYVNDNRARFWERIDYDRAADLLRVTSRKFAQCNCPYAQCPRPAQALCTHCCTAMQAEFFQAMTGRAARVQLDESILLGGERCRTTVRLLAPSPEKSPSPSPSP